MNWRDFRSSNWTTKAPTPSLGVLERWAKRDAQGIHGTLLYDWEAKRHHLPASKREVDWDHRAINTAQRALFTSHR